MPPGVGVIYLYDHGSDVPMNSSLKDRISSGKASRAGRGMVHQSRRREEGARTTDLRTALMPG